jgi:hypothetical protein
METEQRHGFVFLSDRTQLDFSATGAKLDFSALNADDEVVLRRSLGTPQQQCPCR